MLKLLSLLQFLFLYLKAFSQIGSVPVKDRKTNLHNYTICKLPLNITLTREGSNTLAAQRTQRNACPDHTHLAQHASHCLRLHTVITNRSLIMITYR